MPILFTCPACGKGLSAPDSAEGTTAPCPHCHQQITAPRFEVVNEPDPNPFAGVPNPAPTGLPYPPYPEEVPPSGRLEPGAIVSEAVEILKQYPGPILSACLAALGINFVVALARETLAPSGAGAGVNPVGALLSLLLALAVLPLDLGPLYVIDQLLVSGRADLAAFFLGYRRPFTIIGALLLMGAAIAVGLLGLLVGAVIVAVALSLTQMEIVDRGAGALEALGESWRATAGHRLDLFITLVLLTLVALLGLLACGVGIVVTWPIAIIGQVLIYRELRGLKGAGG